MKNLYQTVAVAGANLAALTLNTGDATVLRPHFSGGPESQRVQTMTDQQLRQIEAAHLEVCASCKWGHAAFDPVQVESEALSSEVQALHRQLAEA